MNRLIISRLKSFKDNFKRASNKQSKKNEYKKVMQCLKDAFDAKDFDAFNEIIAMLVKKAAQKNHEAMELLIYLKQQINPAYRQIICLPEELAGDIHFTLVDFERLVGLYREQKAAKEEENV